MCTCTLIPVVVVTDGRYFVLSLADSVWWPIFSRAVMMSLHEAVGVESSQCWSRSILHRAIPPSGDNAMISCSLLTGTSKATPSEYQSFIPASSSVSWWMVGVVIPVHKTCSWQKSKAEIIQAKRNNICQLTVWHYYEGLSGVRSLQTNPTESVTDQISYWLDKTATTSSLVCKP